MFLCLHITILQGNPSANRQNLIAALDLRKTRSVKNSKVKNSNTAVFQLCFKGRDELLHLIQMESLTPSADKKQQIQNVTTAELHDVFSQTVQIEGDSLMDQCEFIDFSSSLITPT